LPTFSDLDRRETSAPSTELSKLWLLHGSRENSSLSALNGT